MQSAPRDLKPRATPHQESPSPRRRAPRLEQRSRSFCLLACGLVRGLLLELPVGGAVRARGRVGCRLRRSLASGHSLLLDEVGDDVARAGRERRAGEEERRERQADGDPANARAPPRGLLHTRLRARRRSQHGKCDGGERQQHEPRDQAWKAIRPLWHCLAPISRRAPRPPLRRGSLTSSSAAATGTRGSSERPSRTAFPRMGGTTWGIPKPRDRPLSLSER